MLRFPGISISLRGIELAIRPQFARLFPPAALLEPPALWFIPIPVPLNDPAKFCNWFAFTGQSVRCGRILEICFLGTEWNFLLTLSLVRGASRRPIDRPISSGQFALGRSWLAWRYPEIGLLKLFVVTGPALIFRPFPFATLPIRCPLYCSTFRGVNPVPSVVYGVLVLP